MAAIAPMPMPRASVAATTAVPTDSSPVGRISRRRLCTVTAPLSPTTSAPPTAAATDDWFTPSLSTDGDTKSDPSIVVSESITVSPPAMPMISPISETSTDSSRPAPVSGNPKSTSSIAEAIERPRQHRDDAAGHDEGEVLLGHRVPGSHRPGVDGPREEGRDQGVDRVRVELGQGRARVEPVHRGDRQHDEHGRERRERGRADHHGDGRCEQRAGDRDRPDREDPPAALDPAQPPVGLARVDLAGGEVSHQLVHRDQAGVVVPGASHHAQQGVRAAGGAGRLDEQRLQGDVDLDQVDTRRPPPPAATLPTTWGAPAPQRSISSPTRAARSRAQRTWVSSGASPGMRMFRYGVRRSRSAIGMGSVGDSPWKIRPERSRGGLVTASAPPGTPSRAPSCGATRSARRR